MAPGQEKYVTSEGIESIRVTLQQEAIPFFQQVKKMVGETDVGFPGFGLLGMIAISPTYNNVQTEMERYMQDAVDVMEAWRTALEDIKRVWRAAEDYSAPKVVQGPNGQDVNITGPAVYQ
ncbi:hypothetical protein [Actinomadura rugatobispora]|uniref:WXG100 family type VII secretion target n=1 Tax=Actinomadura rugatobispora TaxID=1994 RepID=A0ABW1A9Y7_9ACTN|nr:hypothetical protein GCM10010200_045960 [Actinomadura rugatobispora]